jgi:hypothetical protein
MAGRKRCLASSKSIACAALAITLACRHELPAPKRYRTECVGNPPGVDLPARLRDSIREPTSEDEIRSNAIARRFPTYAGYAYRGRFFQVWFTDTSVGRGQLDTIVRLANIENPDTLPFQLAQVRWSYAQLYDWFNYLSPRLMRNNKVWMSGVDLYANRLIFHVSDTVVRHETDSQLVAMNVPCGLVRLQLPVR